MHSKRGFLGQITWAGIVALSISANSFAATKTWVLGGYLPSEPQKKSYVTIEDRKIVAVSAQKPASAELLIDTDDWIFPGLIDMHGHVKYNVLPLWNRALGQFKNRFEWRTRYSPYKSAVSFNMKAFKSDICPAVRWAELKALAGGATAIQGIGGDSKCAKDFGVNNVEISGEFLGNKEKIRAMTDMVVPSLLGAIYEPFIAPKMKSNKLSYDEAYLEMLEDQRILEWVKIFVDEPHTLKNGLRLLIDLDLKIQDPGANTLAAFTSLKPQIIAALAKAGIEKPDAAAKQIATMSGWLFGSGSTKGYLNEAKTEANAYDYITKGGVISVNSTVRRYIGMFENAVRQSLLKYYESTKSPAVIAHLAEGQAKDAYNKLEYGYAQTLGIAQKGLVMIHAVGLNKAELKDAAKKGISIVWSPFSNLLLYGETLDVAGAVKAGVNVSIGSDWSPTGSKNLLDELKLAKRYLKLKKINTISDEMLVKMATENAAKALSLDQAVGKVAPGYQADLLVVKKSGKSGYTDLLGTQQENIQLVAVKGEPLYGESKWIQSAAKTWKEAAPETLKPAAAQCKLSKSIRFPFKSGVDSSTNKSVAGISKTLKSQVQAYTEQVAPDAKKPLFQVDPMFSCEDAGYSKRFDVFVEKEIQENAQLRAKRRKGGFVETIHGGETITHPALSDSFNPLSSADDGGDEDGDHDHGDGGLL